MDGLAALTPAQQAVTERLRSGERRTWPEGMAADLRAALEADLAPFARMLADAGPVNTSDGHLWVGKRPLDLVHTCEGHYDADRDERFAWSVPTARGTVAHKAIELGVGWRGQPLPADLVDGALERLAEGADGLGEFLTELSLAERAELRAAAMGDVTEFLGGFPPLRKTWRPAVEARVRVELLDGRIVLGTKPDLMLGLPEGTTSGRAIIDLKSGGTRGSHRDDLRFYALVETLRCGVPPIRVGTFYLESGHLDTEDVDEAVLKTAIDRVVDGVDKMMAVRTGGREPTLNPGPACGWCAARDGCDGARRWAEERESWGLEPDDPR